MKPDCEVICDLLPLYAENIASERSRELVAAHLKECENCTKALAQIKQEAFAVVPQTADPLRRLRRQLRKHTAAAVIFSAFFAVAAAVLAWGLFFLQPGDEMGYGLLCFYLILPASAFICSWLLSTRPGALKWGCPLLFGALGFLLPWAVFRSMDAIAFFFAFIPALLGLSGGLAAAAWKKKREKRRPSA